MPLTIRFDNSYAQQLEGGYIAWQGDAAPAPKVLKLNHALAAEMGLDPAAWDSDAGAAALTGAVALTGASPLAMAYAGHQFGGFSPRLGDGRALLLGEVIDINGARRDLHLKGSGRTPFSRGGDGKAVLGPVLREYLMGEAMAALGIPTTRALAACTTGEAVLRDGGSQQGAVLARVAASHLRVGTFQYFAARGEDDTLIRLADYAIARHDAALVGQPDRYLRFLENVIARQAELVARWMLVGFVHGVMNTDNVAISGETIDYGPCAFLDAYDVGTVFSSIDAQGRYAFGNQPGIARWNLARLAEALLPLLAADEDAAIELATTAIDGFAALYEAAWLKGMRAKLGLACARDGDMALAQGFYRVMQGQGVDHTNAFRALARLVEGDDSALRAQFTDPEAVADWQARYLARLDQDTQGAVPETGPRPDARPAARSAAMNAVNPVYIPRNHLVEAALAAAAQGDMGPFDSLLTVLAAPYTELAGQEAYAAPAPAAFGRYQTFCGT